MIIKIDAYTNGAHANQSSTPRIVPDGWIVVPPGMVIPDTFPFVDLIVEDGVLAGMTAGVVPEPEPEPVEPPDENEDRDAMLVDLEYRLTLLELGVME